MNKDFFENGEHYISADRASKKFGYAQDYIGQLCREEKVLGKIIKRTWYVSKRSLKQYKKGNDPFLSTSTSTSASTGDVTASTTASSLRTPLGSSTSKLGESVSFISEESLLALPPLVRPVRELFMQSTLERTIVAIVAVFVIGYSGTYLLGAVSPEIALGADMRLADASSASALGSLLNFFSGVRSAVSTQRIVAAVTSTGGPANVDTLGPVLSGGPTYIPNNIALDRIKNELKAELLSYAKSAASGSTQAVAMPVAPTTIVYNTFKTEVLNQAAEHTSRQSQSDVGNVVAQFNALENGGSLTNSTITNAKISGSSFSGSSLTVDSLLGTNATTTNLYSQTLNSQFAIFNQASSTNLQFTNATGTNGSIASLITTSATSTNFFSTTGTFDNLYVNNYEQNGGTSAIHSSVATGDIFSVLDNAITTGTLIHQTFTANAGNGQMSMGQIISLVDSTTAGGGYEGLSINVTGAGSGSGNKYLLDLNPSDTNNQVVFDSTGAFRPTTSIASNTNSLGSPSFYWKNAYIDTLNANNIAGTVTGGNTSSNTWTIGSSEAGDTSKALIFQRNSGSGNATLSWNASNGTLNDQRFLSTNYPFNSTYTVNDSSINPTTNLYSGLLTNNTTAGIQKLLSLTNTGTGTTENGIYLNNTGTGLTAFEIAGTWTNGIVTNNNSIDAGSGPISTTGGLTFGSATGTSATTTNFFTGTASTTNLFATNGNIGFLTTGPITSGLVNGQTISSTANFTGSVAIAGAVTGATSYNGLIITANTGTITSGVWNGTAIDNAQIASGLDVTKVTAGITLPSNVVSSSLTSFGTSPSFVTPILGTPTSGDFSTGTFTWPTFNQNTTGTAANLAGTPNITVGTIASGLINGQTISSAANFTGSLAMNGTFANTSASSSYFTGNVGIGTTAPNFKLEVNGTASTTGFFATNSTTTNATTTNLFATTFAATNLTLTNATTTNFYSSNLNVDNGTLYIDSTNHRVGLGTTAPLARLDLGLQAPGTDTALTYDMAAAGNANWVQTRGAIYDSTSVDQYQIFNGQITGGTKATPTFTGSPTGGYFLRNFTGATFANSRLDLGYFSGTGAGSTGTTTLSIKGDNVGIGTMAPTHKLGIVAPANTRGLSMYQGLGVGDYGAIGFQHSSSNASAASEIRGYNPSGGTDGDLAIAVGDASTGALVERMRVKGSNGNVGIGTTNPGAALEVTGQVKVDGTGSNWFKGYIDLGPAQSSSIAAGDISVARSATEGYINIGSDALRNIHGSGASGSTLLTFNSNISSFPGNVGIGTTAPTEQLSIVKTTDATMSVSGADGWSRIFFKTGGTYNWSWGQRGNANFTMYDEVNSRVPFTIEQGALANSLYIKSSGNVGIGTTNPTYKLEVAGTGLVDIAARTTDVTTGSVALLRTISDSSVFYLLNHASARVATLYGITIGGWTEIRADNNTGTNNGLMIGTQHVVPIVFGTNNLERLRIDGSGNVGIGTTESAGKLAVVSGITKTDTTFTRIASFRSSEALASNPLELYIAQLGNATAASQAMSIQTGHYGADFAANLVLQKDGGNVGIGTTNPLSRLHQVDVAGGNYTGEVRVGGSEAQFGLVLNYSQSGATVGSIYSSPSYNSATTLLKLGTGLGNTNQLVLVGNGNVGIGTTNPLAKLDVRSSATNVAGQSYVANSDASHYIGLYSGQSGDAAQSIEYKDLLKFGTTGAYGSGWSEKMRIDTSGNVGIGTTNPGAKLDIGVQGSTPATYPGLIRAVSGNVDGPGANNGVELSNGGGYGGKFYQNYTNDYIGIATRYGSATWDERLVIKETSGNVGIGTTDPGTAKLNVAAGNNGLVLQGSGATTGFQHIQIGNSGTTFRMAVEGSVGGSIVTGSTAYAALIDNTGAYPVQFATDNTVRMTILPTNGNVGIGTTNPNGNLDIYIADKNPSIAGTTPTGGLIIRTVEPTALTMGVGDVSLNYAGWLQMRHGSLANTVYPLLINPLGGNVGIGTTNPANFKLQVAGSVGPDGTNAYNLGMAGANWGCLYYNSGTLGSCASDARLKNNIQDLSFGADPLGQVAGLRMHTYSFNSDASNSVYQGLVAQEVLNVAPELVSTGSDGYYKVNYGSVQWLTLAAIQQLSLQTDSFASTTVVSLTELRTAIDDQGLRVDSLEADVASLLTTASTTTARLNEQGIRISTLEELLASTTAFTYDSTSTTATTNSLMSNIFMQVKAWLADSANGLTKLFVGEVGSNKSTTKSLCVTDDSGAETCVNKTQLDALIIGALGSNNSQFNSQASSQSSTTDSTIQTNASSTPDNTASSTPDITASSTPPTVYTTASSTPPTDASSTDPVI